MDSYLAAAALCLALSGTVNAGEQREPGDSSPRAALQEVSLEAQRALICQTVADRAAYEVTQLIRDDARDNQTISPEGMEVLSQIRLTEGLASAAFDVTMTANGFAWNGGTARRSAPSSPRLARW